MNAEAKTLAAKLREAASRPGRDNPDYICVITGADALAAADFLDRLAAPEGVGLTRYEVGAWDGNGRNQMRPCDHGAWVRHEDAAAALAAEQMAYQSVKNALHAAEKREAAYLARGDEWQAVAEKAGVCMACALGAHEPYGCTDCLNTGWAQGAPPGYVDEAALATEKARGDEVEQRIASHRQTAMERQRRTEAKAECMEAVLRDAKDNGLIYWEPNTERGSVQKALMLARIDAALAAKEAERAKIEAEVERLRAIVALEPGTRGGPWVAFYAHDMQMICRRAGVVPDDAERIINAMNIVGALVKENGDLKAERDALKAALAPFAEALDEDDFADERFLDRDEIWEHPVAMRITFKHLRDAKRAALAPATSGEG